MKKSGFSMIELVFVIVILGVLAAVAVPRFVTTRTDAQVAMLRSDIASTLKAIPARIFAENIDPTASVPSGYSNWGEWMIDTAGLDRGRWQGSDRYLNPIAEIQNGMATAWCGTFATTSALIQIDSAGNLLFNPQYIGTTNTNGGKSRTLCTVLAGTYPSGSNRTIPLATTGRVKF